VSVLNDVSANSDVYLSLLRDYKALQITHPGLNKALPDFIPERPSTSPHVNPRFII
jgi:hypothetical protein